MRVCRTIFFRTTCFVISSRARAHVVAYRSGPALTSYRVPRARKAFRRARRCVTRMRVRAAPTRHNVNDVSLEVRSGPSIAPASALAWMLSAPSHCWRAGRHRQHHLASWWGPSRTWCSTSRGSRLPASAGMRSPAPGTPRKVRSSTCRSSPGPDKSAFCLRSAAAQWEGGRKHEMGTQGSMQTAGAALNCLPLHSFALCVPPPEHLEEGAWWGKRTHCCEDWEVRLPARRGPASKLTALPSTCQARVLLREVHAGGG